MKATWQPSTVFSLTLLLLTFGKPILGNELPGSDKPPDSTKLLQMADSLLSRRKNVEAQQLYRRVLEIEPKSSAAHAGLGWTLYDTGHHNAAYSEEQKALELDYNNALAHHYLASMYLQVGKYQEAADEYRIEFKIAPKRRCHCGPVELLLKQYPARKS
jgi:tetratricopeptide (TPR) repeat protein